MRAVGEFTVVPGGHICLNRCWWDSLTLNRSSRCFSETDRRPRRSMNRPEYGRVQLALKFLQGLADQRLLSGRHHLGVLGIGLKINHFIDRDHDGVLADGGVDPAQVPARCGGLGQFPQQDVEIGRHRAQALLQPVDGQSQSSTLERLQDVIHRTGLECGDRVHVVRGHERDVAAALNLLRNVQARQQRHLDVEEQDVGSVPLDQIQRFDTGASFADDTQCRPELAQVLTQLVAQQRFVFGQNGGRGRHRFMPCRF